MSPHFFVRENSLFTTLNLPSDVQSDVNLCLLNIDDGTFLVVFGELTAAAVASVVASRVFDELPRTDQ